MSGAATPDPSRAAVERTVREHWGYILAALVAHVRDLELAEDALQDAAVAALRSWPGSGVPDHPRAWLLKAARNRAVDRLRRDARFAIKQRELARLTALAASPDEEGPDVIDERLALLFTCCHPALGEDARVALTLRSLGGLKTSEIARAFLLPDATMAQRLVRAKRKIRDAGIPFRVPPPELWPERLASVLAVVYFVFNEGYAASSGRRLTRTDLCEEAIRLGRLLSALAPREPETTGLLALMLLHDARRAARTDADGRYVPLDRQDRTLWDREAIAEGDALLRGALAAGRPGPYQLQAAISAVHASAASHERTDWRQIVGLYRKLGELHPSPVVRLNEIVARSFVDGPGAALEALSRLEAGETLGSYQPFHAARADLLRRAGRVEEAAAAYRRAIASTDNATERAFLERRLHGLAPG